MKLNNYSDFSLSLDYPVWYSNEISFLNLDTFQFLSFPSSPKCHQPTMFERKLSKSDSVPNLHETESLLLKSSSPSRRVARHHPHKHHHHSNRTRKASNEHRSHVLRFQRFALSVDESHPLQPESSHGGSQCSVTFDPKPEIIDIVSVHKKREQRNKRSDTAKKHVLSRQMPIEQREDSHQTQKIDDERRPSSAQSDNYYVSPEHKDKLRMGGSVDARSPERVMQRNSPKKIHSTPSVDKDFR